MLFHSVMCLSRSRYEMILLARSLACGSAFLQTCGLWHRLCSDNSKACAHSTALFSVLLVAAGKQLPEIIAYCLLPLPADKDKDKDIRLTDLPDAPPAALD